MTANLIAQYPQSSAMSLIAEKTVATASASLTFPGIPQTFKHLRLVGDFEITSGVNLVLTFNGDSTNSHYTTNLVTSNGGSATAYQPVGAVASQILIAGPLGSVVVEIPGYSNSTFPTSLTSVFNYSTVGVNGLSGAGGGSWVGNSPTSITLADSSGTALFAVGSIFSLYGIS